MCFCPEKWAKGLRRVIPARGGHWGYLGEWLRTLCLFSRAASTHKLGENPKRPLAASAQHTGSCTILRFGFSGMQNRAPSLRILVRSFRKVGDGRSWMRTQTGDL